MIAVRRLVALPLRCLRRHVVVENADKILDIMGEGTFGKVVECWESEIQRSMLACQIHKNGNDQNMHLNDCARFARGFEFSRTCVIRCSVVARRSSILRSRSSETCQSDSLLPKTAAQACIQHHADWLLDVSSHWHPHVHPALGTNSHSVRRQ